MDLKILMGFVLIIYCGLEISAAPELCPCLPINLCPRVYGASEDDRKYLGEFLKCPKDLEVRCCGASVSSIANSVEHEEEEKDPAPYPFVYNDIEDVRMEHLTMPPPILMTTEIPEETTTELMDTATMIYTTESPIETTTMTEEEDMTTTEGPVEEVTPRFGRGVEFIYAVAANDPENKRKGKKLFADTEDVFVIMPQQFLEEDNLLSETEEATTTTTTTSQAPPTTMITSTSTTTTSTTEGQNEDDDVAVTTTTEMPEITTTLSMITTTRRPRIRKKIRVKVRKGFKKLERLHPNDLVLLDETDIATKENTRKNRDLDDAPKRKINHSLYARRKHLLEMRNNIVPTTTTTTEAPVTVPVEPSTTTEAAASSAHQNPALLTILTSNATKRKNFLNRRLLLKDEVGAIKREAVAPPNASPSSTPEAVQVESVSKVESENQVEGHHQQMIEQVARAVQQNSLMNTFDIADELMDPEMAVRIAGIQKMLAEEIMEKVLAKIGVQINSPKEAAVSKTKAPIIQRTTTTTESTPVATENPIDAPESREPMHPYRGSKRYIDTNFLNAYENVIHKVEEKIKTHKNRGKAGRPPPPQVQVKTVVDATRPSTTTTTSKPVKTTTTTENPGNVQILLNQNRRRNQLRNRINSSTSTTAMPITEPTTAVTEENNPALETITEIIEKLEEIESHLSPKDFKPSQLWQIIRSDDQQLVDTDELSAPIDLLGRNARALNNSGYKKILQSGFVPIPSSQYPVTLTGNSADGSLTLPSLARVASFA